MRRYDIFISHATADQNAAEVLCGALETAGCTVFLATRHTSLGTSWMRTISRAQDDSRMTLALISRSSQQADYQLDEIHAAITMSREAAGNHVLLPVMLDTSEGQGLLGVRAVQAIRWHGATQDELPNLVDAARRVVERVKQEEKVIVFRDRGGFARSVFQGYTNAALFAPTAPSGQLDYDENRKQLVAEVAGRGTARLNEQLLYTSRSCAKAWLDLCNTQSYRPYQESKQLIDNYATRIAALISADCSATSFDVISLGPGSGEKDKALLHSFADLDRRSQLYYYPFDISQYLIAHACNRITEDALLRENVRVVYINDEFANLERLRPIYWNNVRRNVFALLGNTIGNYDESQIVSWITRGMEPRDYLIIEYQERRAKAKANNGERDYSDAKRAFFLAPLLMMGWDPKTLEVFTTASTTAVTVPGSEKFVTSARSDRGTFRLTESTQYRCNDLIAWFASKHMTLVGKAFRGETVGVLVLRYDPPSVDTATGARSRKRGVRTTKPPGRKK